VCVCSKDRKKRYGVKKKHSNIIQRKSFTFRRLQWMVSYIYIYIYMHTFSAKLFYFQGGKNRIRKKSGDGEYSIGSLWNLDLMSFSVFFFLFFFSLFVSMLARKRNVYEIYIYIHIPRSRVKFSRSTDFFYSFLRYSSDN
jgi:hypothetical protein